MTRVNKGGDRKGLVEKKTLRRNIETGKRYTRKKTDEDRKRRRKKWGKQEMENDFLLVLAHRGSYKNAECYFVEIIPVGDRFD
jgi:hypothetical protein